MKILIMGYYGFGNMGDEAILVAILEELGRRFPHVAPVLLYPDGVEAPPAVEVLIRDNVWHLFTGIKDSQILLCGGGSLLQDVTSRKSLLYYLGIMGLALFFRKRLLIIGQGMGPLQSGWGRFFIPRILNRAAFVGLRDELSLNLLRQLGVSEKKIHLGADLALSLDPVERDQARELLEKEGFPFHKKGLALSFRPGPMDAYYDLFVPFIRAFAQEKGLVPVFFPLFPPEDLPLAQRLRRDLPGSILIQGTYGPRETMGMIGEMQMLIGVRLHALIFAARVLIPFVGISYDPKVKGFLRLFGLEGAMVVEGDDGENFYTVLSSSYLDWEDRRMFVEKRLTALRGRVHLIWDLLEEEVKSW